MNCSVVNVPVVFNFNPSAFVAMQMQIERADADTHSPHYHEQWGLDSVSIQPVHSQPGSLTRSV